MTGLTHQLEALQRIAVFSAGMRGHRLDAWRTCELSATAACSKCGRTVTVYVSFLQPEMDGLAVSEECGERAAQVA
jgi:hypothetical protein